MPRHGRHDATRAPLRRSTLLRRASRVRVSLLPQPDRYFYPQASRALHRLRVPRVPAGSPRLPLLRRQLRQRDHLASCCLRRAGFPVPRRPAPTLQQHAICSVRTTDTDAPRACTTRARSDVVSPTPRRRADSASYTRTFRALHQRAPTVPSSGAFAGSIRATANVYSTTPTGGLLPNRLGSSSIDFYPGTSVAYAAARHHYPWSPHGDTGTCWRSQAEPKVRLDDVDGSYLPSSPERSLSTEGS